MKITEALKAFLTEKHGLKSGASDSDVVALISQQVIAGKLTYDEVARHNGDGSQKSSDPKAAVTALIDERLDTKLTPISNTLSAVEALLKGNGNKSPEAPAATPVEGDANVNDAVQKQVDAMVSKALGGMGFNAGGTKGPSPAEVFSKGVNLGPQDRVRVKTAADRYMSVKSNRHWEHGPNRGQPMVVAGKQMETASQQDYAIIGAHFKLCANRELPSHALPQALKMTEHDWDLVKYSAHEMSWRGFVGKEEGHASDIEGRKLSDFEIKALLDDSAGSGFEALPIIFDDQVVQGALLQGELFPYVELINLERGRQINAFSLGRPVISETAEGSSITLTNTAGLTAALSSTTYCGVGAMEIGLDFASDTPVNIGQIITKNFQEASAAWLDKVIAVGNGTTQPTGIFTSSNTVVYNSANGVGGPLTIGDFEGLMFTLPKAERTRAGAYLAFVGTDQVYRRSRSIPRGPNDQQRIFGMDHDGYTVMEKPYKVQGDLSDNQLAYCNLQRYRMYRRLGASLRYEQGGQTLALRNTSLIILRMRYAGQPMIPSGFAIMPDAPTVG